ncbi:MAG: HNH endonuclease [Flavipsychrobacter sp.]|nr:HNH endonuclease [Flavipsychrobacter sp.]
MSACYSCNQILNKKTTSFEHIIPNSIGGVLKSARLICKTCNSAYGMTIDAALAKKFVDLVALMNIERHRSRPVNDTNSSNWDRYQLENGNDLFLRSVAKIAVNYYLTKVRGRHHLDKMIRIINGVEAIEDHIRYHPLIEVIWNDKEVSHVIRINGTASSGRLYAHVILFNTHSLVINLCNNYNGEDIDLFYRYDVLRQKEIRSTID